MLSSNQCIFSLDIVEHQGECINDVNAPDIVIREDFRIDLGRGVEAKAYSKDQCLFFCKNWPRTTACQYSFAEGKCIAYLTGLNVIGNDAPGIKCFVFSGRFYLARIKYNII